VAKRGEEDEAALGMTMTKMVAVTTMILTQSGGGANGGEGGDSEIRIHSTRRRRRSWFLLTPTPTPTGASTFLSALKTSTMLASEFNHHDDDEEEEGSHRCKRAKRKVPTRRHICQCARLSHRQCRFEPQPQI
jgi:hypothetical protein